MKVAPFLLLIWGATCVRACADDYEWCKCVNPGGVFNYTATKRVCDSHSAAMANYTDPPPGWEACAASLPATWNNCDWRRDCDTGADSWCGDRD
jgi:hypothetical protein